MGRLLRQGAVAAGSWDDGDGPRMDPVPALGQIHLGNALLLPAPPAGPLICMWVGRVSV